MITLPICVLILQAVHCFGGSANTYNLERPGRNLCVNQDVDCSNQVKSSAPETCLMRYFNKSSKECTDEEFKGIVDHNNQFGTVNLSPYPWFETSIPFSALNITFSNISWRRLRMRFVQIGSEKNELCREFMLSGGVDLSTIISFDCLWSKGTIGGLNYKFQYLLTTGDGHKYLSTYLLKIPKDVDVLKGIASDNCGLFAIMDETAFPIISLKLQVPPSELNVSKVKVGLFYKEELGNQNDIMQAWTEDIANEKPGDFINIGVFDTKNALGYYHYNASFSNCYRESKVVELSTPTLQVTGPKFGLGALTVGAFILIFGMLGIFLWRNIWKKNNKGSRNPPNVLFIYESCYPSHIENIYKFKEFLEENCYVAPKLDLVEIPKTYSMNPWKWYYSAFEEADYVLVFASPDESTEKGVHEDNVYPGLYTYALKLLLVYLVNKHRFLVACVKLPGCSWRLLPSEVSVIKERFSLPEKMSNFFKFLKIPPVKNGSSAFIKALKQSRNYPKLIVSRPSAPLPLPFDADDFSFDEEVREPLTIGHIAFNLDGHSTSEEDDEDILTNESIVTDYRL